MLKLDPIQTVALAGLVLIVGYRLCRHVSLLRRYNIPAPVVGGLPVALLNLGARQSDVALFAFDTLFREPLMVAFFTAIGFGASLALLRAGGPQMVLFLAAATFFGAVQNAVGIPLALLFGLHPLFGVLAGSVSLTGGPATASAFAGEFAKAGVSAAEPVALSSAMAGIVVAGLVGGPVGTWLIERRLRAAREMPTASATPDLQPLPASPVIPPAGEFDLLKSVALILLAMWLGSWLSDGLEDLGLKLPSYVGAMIVAAVLRNLDDATGWIGLDPRTLLNLGHVALGFFLAIALMTLKLWELAGLAVPLLVILAAQVMVTVAISVWPIFPLMGRDHDAAVMSSGFCGFMLGTTANAMANMTALVERYGPAPRAFLVVPLVGAFFIDFTNALLITACLQIFG